MAKKRKVEELQATDFPGVDPVKFGKWRASAAKYEPIGWIAYFSVLIVATGAFILLRPFRGVPAGVRIPLFALALFGLLLGTLLLITREPRRLAKEAGIEPNAIKKARARPRTKTSDGATAHEAQPVSATGRESAMPENAPLVETTTMAGTPSAQGHPTSVAGHESGQGAHPQGGSKRCPKCGTANKPDAFSCFACRSPI